MTLPELSIRRPVMAAMFAILVIVAGIICYLELPVQLHPNINYPVITITTEMPGGNVNLINQVITKQIEKQINSISGIKSINSTSTPGKSQIQINFHLGQNLQQAYSEISSRVSRIRSLLPRDARAPVIAMKRSNESAIMLLSLHGASQMAMNSYARNIIEKRLQRVSGVAEVSVGGASREVVDIRFDLGKMAANKITPIDIESAFKNNQISVPGGTIKSGKNSYGLNLDFKYHQVHKLGDMVVVYRKNAPIFLKDIATVSFGFADNTASARFHGQPAISISIMKKSGVNTVAVDDEVKKVLNNDIIPHLPGDMHLTVIYNQATYIKGVVSQLVEDIWISVIAALFIILLFLKSFKSLFIVLCSIPVSLLGGVAVLHTFGYSINIITLLSLIVLVGVVVDDSIVVLENVFRRITHDNQPAYEATINGSNQIVFSVLASSLTLICIFFPIIFMGGMLAKLLTSMGVVITGGVIVSLIVALTIVPVLCLKLIKPTDANYTGISLSLEKVFLKIEAVYKKLIHTALRFRWLTILAALFFILISIPGFLFVEKEMFPAANDMGYFSIDIQPPQGLTAQYTVGRIKALEALLDKQPDVSHYFTMMGPGKDGTVIVEMKPGAKSRQLQLMSTLRTQVTQLAGAEYMVQGVGGGGGGSGLSFEVQGPNYEKALEYAMKLGSKLEAYSDQLGMIYLHYSTDQPQLEIAFDEILAESMGISSGKIAQTLSILSSEGVRIGHFTEGSGGSERYDVILRPQEGSFSSPNDLSNIYLWSNNAKEPLRLDTIAKFKESLAPSKISRTNLEYSVGISSTPRIGLEKATQLVQKIAAETLPAPYELKLTGSSASFASAEHHMILIFALMLMLIYMVLASQFNSFLQPVIVMIAQPLAIAGGIIILWASHQILSIYSIIGILLLVGLVSKNSILLIDLTNQLVREGKSIHEALLEACPIRMRPVIMTSLAIMLAMLPAALQSGPGASSYRPMAWVIIGGMCISTILTLIVVPSLYSVFRRFVNVGKNQSK